MRRRIGLHRKSIVSAWNYSETRCHRRVAPHRNCPKRSITKEVHTWPERCHHRDAEKSMIENFDVPEKWFAIPARAKKLSSALPKTNFGLGSSAGTPPV